MKQNKEKQQDIGQIEKLLEIMAGLRDSQGGCPWDLEQDFSTIAPYTIEEAYEVADAIERGDFNDLRDELGDLLFQVVFHARMAEEAGHFAFADAVQAICDKMLRRHPHVFADAEVDGADAQTVAWEEQKAQERQSRHDDHKGDRHSILDNIPIALPALTRAEKLGKRAARAGFDWPDVTGPLAKIDEELGEIAAAMQAIKGTDSSDGRERLESELGDLFFAVVNACRHLRVDPEKALRGANSRFERRFAYIEVQLAKTGESPENAGLERLEALWEQAKDRGL
jgi:MazG family protein